MFESFGPTDGIEESHGHYAVGKQDGAEMKEIRTLLPRRSGEPRFAPLQYFYPASKTGVVPS